MTKIFLILKYIAAGITIITATYLNAGEVTITGDEYIASTGVPDLNGNLMPDIAFLRINDDGRNRVYIKDGSTDETLKEYTFLKGHRAIDVTVIDDMNNNGAKELVVTAINDETLKVVSQIRDLETGEVLNIIAAKALQGKDDDPGCCQLSTCVSGATANGCSAAGGVFTQRGICSPDPDSNDPTLICR